MSLIRINNSLKSNLKWDLDFIDVILGIKLVKHFERITLTQSYYVEKCLRSLTNMVMFILKHLMMQAGIWENI